MESNYLKLVEDCYNCPTHRLFGKSLHFDLHSVSTHENIIVNDFPLMTHKRISFHNVKEELKFFLRGETDVRKLQSKNVHIWDQNASLEFKQKHNLRLSEYDLGPVYGSQWTHWQCNSADHDIDQVQQVAKELASNPLSRQCCISGWNPEYIHFMNPTCSRPMVLPPCHTMYQFLLEPVETNSYKIHTILFQRSGDLLLGIPYNIASVSLFTLYMIQYIKNYNSTMIINTGSITIHFGDLHIYPEQLSVVSELLQRPTHPLPRLSMSFNSKNILESTVTLLDYNSEPKLSIPLICN